MRERSLVVIFISVVWQGTCSLYYVNDDVGSMAQGSKRCRFIKNGQTSGSLTQQCRTHDLTTFTEFLSSVDNHIFWVNQDNECPINNCQAIVFNSSDITPISLVCRQCTIHLPYLCVSHHIPTVSPTVRVLGRTPQFHDNGKGSTVDGIRFKELSLDCALDWIRYPGLEFRVVLTRMTFQEATYSCRYRHQGDSLLNLLHSSLLAKVRSFLSDRMDHYWIEDRCLNNNPYASTVNRNGTVQRKLKSNLLPSICQRSPQSDSQPSMNQVTGHDVIVGKFRHEKDFDGVFGPANETETNQAFNILHCTRHCLRRAECISLFYDVTSLECQLNKKAFSVRDTLQRRSGAVYYTKK